VISDYHIHTSLCGHAEGEMRAYVEQTLAAGVTEMGFADHLPLLLRWETGLSMTPDDMGDYVAAVQSLTREYAPDLRIVLGIRGRLF